MVSKSLFICQHGWITNRKSRTPKLSQENPIHWHCNRTWYFQITFLHFNNIVRYQFAQFPRRSRRLLGLFKRLSFWRSSCSSDNAPQFTGRNGGCNADLLCNKKVSLFSQYFKLTTWSKWQAIRVTIFSSIFEPLGVVLVHTLFGNAINEYMLHALFGVGTANDIVRMFNLFSCWNYDIFGYLRVIASSASVLWYWKNCDCCLRWNGIVLSFSCFSTEIWNSGIVNKNNHFKILVVSC